MDATLYDFDCDVNNVPLDSKYEYKLKTVSFLNGSTDFIVTKIKHVIQKTYDDIRGFEVVYPKTLTDEEQEAKRLENIERASRRAKKAVHYTIRQIQADHLLTLSTRENITERAKFFEIFTRFIRLVREYELINGKLVKRENKLSYAYCAVPELQDRGAFHMHCAVVGKQNIPHLRACWYVALGGNVNDVGDDVRGQVDVQYRQKMWGNKTENFKTFSLVRYLTKYISKGFTETTELGVHRYSKSRDVPPPHITNQLIVSCSFDGFSFVDAILEVNRIAEFITGANPATMALWNRYDEIFILRHSL